MQFLTTVALLSASALAAPNIFPFPIIPVSSGQCKEQLATFDDLTSLPAVSELSPIGVYQGINFVNFDVEQPGAVGLQVAGLTPTSTPNVASTGTTNMLMGSPSFNASGIKSFKLESLYFGCVVDSEETAAGVPEDCTVSFTAFKAGQTEAFQTLDYSFTPTNLVLSPLMQITFPSTFDKLSFVEIAVVASTTPSALTGLFIDNVKHCNYS